MAVLTAHNLADEDPVLLESLDHHFQNNGLERLRLMPEVGWLWFMRTGAREADSFASLVSFPTMIYLPIHSIM